MKKHTGFTLIELLVTIAIIAILTAIITANFSIARSRSRDAKRISDISSIQLALSLYFDRCNQYPADLDTAVNLIQDGCNNAQTGISLGSFIGKIPTPPQPGQVKYTYGTNVNIPSGIPVPTDYLIGVQLENPTDSLKDIPAPAYLVPCSVDGKYYCAGPK